MSLELTHIIDKALDFVTGENLVTVNEFLARATPLQQMYFRHSVEQLRASGSVHRTHGELRQIAQQPMKRITW